MRRTTQTNFPLALVVVFTATKLAFGFELAKACALLLQASANAFECVKANVATAIRDVTNNFMPDL